MNIFHRNLIFTENLNANFGCLISNLINFFLIHGHVSDNLLVATIVPLIKDKLDNVESSDNYRSIAISSVILRIDRLLT